MALNEPDACWKFVVLKIQEAGWGDPPHAVSEQRCFTDGRILFIGSKARRGTRKRSDYLLRYGSDGVQ